MQLRLTNTLNGRIEDFHPIKPGKVSIYCCGVTVYDLCHLGHARSYIVWDVLRRYLTWIGYEVTFVQNFTDIDDKILKKAKEEGSTMQIVSERNIQEFHKDMDSLGIIKPDRMPKATKCLDPIRNLIKELQSKGVAYSIDGDVYFSVMKHTNYGKLSGRDLSQQQQNADGRIKESEEAKKQHPFDFALWKSAKPEEPSFPSPWGQGRPGWHIECSAMVKEELGETIDIHLGGADLIFPHHENEIAQSESLTGKQLANFWLHNGMVNVGGQKMSKSLNNFTTIRALLNQGISPMTLRLFVLQAHYRKPLDFTHEALNAASKGWEGLNKALSLNINHGEELGWTNDYLKTNNNLNSKIDLAEEDKMFRLAMNDDLNTSGGLSVIFELARPLRTLANRLEHGEANQLSEGEKRVFYQKWVSLIELAKVLGFKPEKIINSKPQQVNEESILQAIEDRKKAKSNKDYSKADSIREDLRRLGIELIDKSGGITEWIKK
ncbi:cysteine--tRNA ligase [Prochlorococcus sp. MIT 1300]|uniref:cysteine--tRNA ligase n=1 Tax=Prochlorococcus sp. MIT 1300 TaxID=3096218 RepID=UPI002A75C1FB|nr:cysteine--tRNA ligase [Prochlorococcus sp. MIT 1300]